MIAPFGLAQTLLLSRQFWVILIMRQHAVIYDLGWINSKLAAIFLSSFYMFSLSLISKTTLPSSPSSCPPHPQVIQCLISFPPKCITWLRESVIINCEHMWQLLLISPWWIFQVPVDNSRLASKLRVLVFSDHRTGQLYFTAFVQPISRYVIRSAHGLWKPRKEGLCIVMHWFISHMTSVMFPQIAPVLDGRPGSGTQISQSLKRRDLQLLVYKNACPLCRHKLNFPLFKLVTCFCRLISWEHSAEDSYKSF